MDITHDPAAGNVLVRTAGRALSWIAHALVIGLIVAAFAFGGPDDNDAVRADGIELDAHSDGLFDATGSGTGVESVALGG